MACSAYGQIGGGGGGLPANPSAQVVVAARVLPIHYSATYSKPEPGATAGTPYADFQASVQVSLPEGYVVDTSHASGGYQWNGEWQTGWPALANGLLLCLSPNSSTTVARAYDVGEYSTSCTVYWEYIPTGQKGYAVGTYPPQGKRILAVGGPYSVELRREDHPVSSPPSIFDNPPVYDRNPDGTWHLQFFNYDTELALDPSSVPNSPNTQVAQLAKVSRRYAQPDGVTYVWEALGAKIVDPDTVEPTTTLITIGATSGSAQGAISVKLQYEVADDGESFGPFEDYSEEFPAIVEPDATREYSDASYYLFTAHKPTSSNHFWTSLETYQTGPPLYQYWGAAQSFRYRVLDQNGIGQPGLWLQERFVIDTSRYRWTSNGDIENLHATDNNGNPVSGLLFETNAGSASGSGFTVWTTLDTPEMGLMSNTDNLSGYLSFYKYADALGQVPLWDFDHYYFAATKSTT